MTEADHQLTVRNGTGHPISRAYSRAHTLQPGRSIPWYKDQFNHEISGGLEAGEEASWRLAPNMFSGWGRVTAPSDALFTVEVVKLDGPKVRRFSPPTISLQQMRQDYPA